MPKRLGGETTTNESGESGGIPDRSEYVSGRNHILVIDGTRYTLVPSRPNGRTLYFFFGFPPGSTSDQEMREEEAPFIEDDVIYAAEQGFTVIYDLEGTAQDLGNAIFDPQAYGIYWSGHGNGRGYIWTSDDRLIAPESIRSGVAAGRQVAPNLSYFILAACNSAQIAEEWQGVLPSQCRFEGWVDTVSTSQGIDFTDSGRFGDSLFPHGGTNPDMELRDYIDAALRETRD
ncbi:hypothetical protein [Leptolyngbya sp. PCC 6406]|uniref:hypothetical protein n=1 Tax=Leptolyngbya sp. PCC 6406 TaxID=1173264 RepID=UPI0012DCA7E1|nr:hypothetical protein [Leptolyngbya sp. PCC 6406]